MKQVVLVITLCVVGLAASAFGNSVSYNVSGTSGTDSVSGIVTFTTTLTGFTVEIRNTTPGIYTVRQVLDGLTFGTGGGSFTLSSVAFGSQTGSGVESCSTTGKGQNKTTTCTDPAYTSDAWQYANGVLEPQGFKPDGVINESVDTTCQTNCSSIPNDQHNPYFIDPIFTFTGTLNLTRIGTITTDWGTGPVCIRTPEPPVSQVPEPTSVALFATGVFTLCGKMLRRRGTKTVLTLG